MLLELYLEKNKEVWKIKFHSKRTWVRMVCLLASHANKRVASFPLSQWKALIQEQWFNSYIKKKIRNKTSKEKQSEPSLFQAAGKEFHSLLSPASGASKCCFIRLVKMFFFWISSCCLSKSSWIWMSTACSSLVIESNSSVRPIRKGKKRYND